MRADDYETQRYQVVFKQKIIAQAKKQDIKGGITAAARRIPKGLQRQKTFKGGVKKIYRPQNIAPDGFVNLFHAGYLVINAALFLLKIGTFFCHRRQRYVSKRRLLLCLTES